MNKNDLLIGHFKRRHQVVSLMGILVLFKFTLHADIISGTWSVADDNEIKEKVHNTPNTLIPSLVVCHLPLSPLSRIHPQVKSVVFLRKGRQSVTRDWLY